jgi:hypothetical protein
MSEQVHQAIGRQLPAGARPDELVFPGPGGSNGIPRGARTPLSTHNLRRVYQAAVAAAGDDLAHLDLHGPHDLRHTFATWLEDAGIPSRVIDELMGHTGGRRQGGASGSPMGKGLPGDDANDAGSCHRGPGRTDRPRTGSRRKPAARRRRMD